MVVMIADCQLHEGHKLGLEKDGRDHDRAVYRRSFIIREQYGPAAGTAIEVRLSYEDPCILYSYNNTMKGRK